MPTPERRHFSRILFSHSAVLTQAGERHPAEVLDLSLKGALVRLPAGTIGKVTKGGDCVLSIALAPDVEVSMNGTITHCEANAVGLRCDSIDCDSISHLRRLVELNLGDDALLQREFSALLKLD